MIRLRVEDVVRRIPTGRVTTYGAVARRVGHCTPRQVGLALSSLPDGSTVPWHRVINGKGAISLPGAGGRKQHDLLVAEGIEFDARGHTDLDRFGWGAGT